MVKNKSRKRSVSNLKLQVQKAMQLWEVTIRKFFALVIVLVKHFSFIKWVLLVKKKLGKTKRTLHFINDQKTYSLM